MNEKAIRWITVFGVLAIAYLVNLPVWLTILGVFAALKI